MWAFCLWTTSTQGLQRPEDGVRSKGTELRLWATMWVLRIEPRSLTRAVSALKYRTIPPVPLNLHKFKHCTGGGGLSVFAGGYYCACQMDQEGDVQAFTLFPRGRRRRKSDQELPFGTDKKISSSVHCVALTCWKHSAQTREALQLYTSYGGVNGLMPRI